MNAVGESRNAERSLWLVAPLKALVTKLDQSENIELSLANLAYLAGGIELADGSLESSLESLNVSRRIASAAHAANPSSEEAIIALTNSLNLLSNFYVKRRQHGDIELADSLRIQSRKLTNQFYWRSPHLLKSFWRYLSGLPRKIAEDLEKTDTASRFEFDQKWHDRHCTMSFEFLRKSEFYRNRGLRRDHNKSKRMLRKGLKHAKIAMKHVPESEDALGLAAKAFGALCAYSVEANDLKQAIKHGKESLKLNQQRSKNNPSGREIESDVARSMLFLGSAYLRQSDFSDRMVGLGYLENSEEIRRKLYLCNKDSLLAARELTETLIEIASFFKEMNGEVSLKKAETFLREALEISRSKYERNSNSAEAAQDVAVVCVKLGDFLRQRDNGDDIEEAHALYVEGAKVSYPASLAAWPREGREKEDYEMCRRRASLAYDIKTKREYEKRWADRGDESG